MPGAAKRPFGGIWNKGSRSGLGMFADGGEMHAECAAPNGAKAFLSYFLCPTKSREKVAARTCKKLPVASFCASETAETGRIANGREQGDHVSRSRRSPATHDSKLCRKRLRRNFRRHVSKPVLSAKRRRRGFESVRKGYCSADARPLFFENEKVYCKLTVSCRG